jgi:hypothetical protein
MRPLVRAAVVFFIPALFLVVSFILAQQSPVPAAPPACSQTDTCKAVENANAAAVKATSAVTNAQQAADQAQTAESHAGDSAKAAKDAADKAAKAATDASTSAKTAKALRSGTTLGPLPRRAKGRSSIDDYVPCIFDDDEVRDMRTLESPPALDKDTPLDDSTAGTMAGIVQQVFYHLASSEGSGDESAATTLDDRHSKKNKKTNLAQQSMQQPTKQQQQILDFAESLTPDKFVTLLPSQVPAKVRELATKARLSEKTIETGVNQVATASNARQKFNRPDDVSCSFSVLQWKETSDTFGRRVANQYVALEVNVRNLNQQNEFLIHDIQIAVDTGLNRAQFGRFQAARDKLVVRDVAQRGQSEDARNRVINTLQMVGAIAGGASTAVTEGLMNSSEAQDMAASVAIFQGPVMTGLTNIFPDHTLEHINHLNDLAFSASSTSKTVVPIQGSVPLITFLSEKPLEQLPFSRCGTSVTKKLWYSLYFHESQDDSQDADSAGSSTYQFCKLDPYDLYDNPIPQPGNLQPNYYMQPYHFRKWSGAALSVLEHRIFVVIAGVHIKEVQKQPTLSSISCAPGNDATIDLSKITGPNATCTLKGADLDLVSQVSLQNAIDSNDKTQVQGTSSVSGDTTQATVTFLKDDLAKLKATTYKLYYSLKGGGPQPTSLVLTIKQAVSLDHNSIDFGNQTVGKESDPKSVVITNNNTDAKSAPLTFTITKIEAAPTSFILKTDKCTLEPGKTCPVSVTFKPSTAGSKKASLNISYDAPGSPLNVDLTGTGSVAAVVPAAPPAIAPAPKGP